MSARQLIAEFDRLAEAPDAIPRLRQFVRELAIRGKLVPQDTHDEPAEKLLKRLQSRQSQLIEQKKIRAPRLLEQGVDDPPFAIPSPWEWCQLSEVGAVVGGGTPPSGDADNFAEPGEGIPWVTPADLGKDRRSLMVARGSRDLSEKGLSASSATLLPVGSVLFTSRAPIGYVGIAANEMSTNQGFKSVIPFEPETNHYIALYFHAFTPWIEARASGTTFREVSAKVVASLPFPLPPLAEQRRIVAKVDELMALCDRLEAAQAERERRRDRLAAAARSRVARGEPGVLLAQLHRVTSGPDQVGPFRHAVLQLAVTGRLVPQREDEGSASELLRHIEAERRELIRQKKIRKSSDLGESRVQPDTEIPASWQWARLGDIGDWGSGSTPSRSKPEYFGGMTPWLKSGELNDNMQLRGSEEKVTETAVRECSFRLNHPGDVLIAMYGATIGKLAILAEPAVTNQAVCGCTPFGGVSNKYLYYYLLSRREDFKAESEGGAQPNISKVKIVNFPLPLPPSAEQERIVEKVEQIMALCDRLESELSRKRTLRSTLLKSVLHHTL